MEPDKEFTLRVDLQPIRTIEGVREAGPKEIHLYLFDNLDEAFLHFYSIPVKTYDKEKALLHGARFFVENASITKTGQSHSLMALEKPTTAQPGNRPRSKDTNHVFFINKGQSHLLLSEKIRSEFFFFNMPQISMAKIPIATYDLDGAVLRPVHGLYRDALLAKLRPEESTRRNTPFSVVTRSNMYGKALLPGATNGTTVVEIAAYADVGQAFARLVTRTDLPNLDHMIAFNHDLRRAINSAELFDKSADERLAQLLTLHYNGMHARIPKAGAYLHFESLTARDLIESALPATTRLNRQPPDLFIQIGSYTNNYKELTETQEYSKFKIDLQTLYQPQKRNMSRHSRPDPREENPKKDTGPKI